MVPRPERRRQLADAGRRLQRGAYNVPADHPGGQETGDREMVLARWGLVPFFTKDLGEVKGLSTINARAETIATAKTWREPVKKRRCLVPVNAFYEWPKLGSTPKQPYAFELASAGLFAFAGIWDAWKDAQGHWLQSFAIVTTEANELMASIHPRMPVILHAP